MTEKTTTQKEAALSVTHVVVDAASVVAELSEVSGLTVDQLHDALAKGGVWLSVSGGKNGVYKKPVRTRVLDGVAGVGDKVHLNYDEQVLLATSATPTLISDQVNYSFWYKPAGVFSQGTRWGDHCSMPFLVAREHGKPAWLVHRLDRAASGLMILAHTRNALKQLTGVFEKRGIKKTYQARVHGVLQRPLPLELNAPVDGKAASSSVLGSIECDDDTSLLTLTIKTGRKHQIRSHLSSIGHPVVGDRLFDAGKQHKLNLQLVAVSLELQCPFTGNNVAVSLPDKFTLQKVWPGPEQQDKPSLWSDT